MANPPPSFSFFGPSFAAPAPPAQVPSSTHLAPVPPEISREWETLAVKQLIADLADPFRRDNALLELVKKRETFQDLAPLLWYTFGTIGTLLQEIVLIYPSLSPPTLSSVAANRVCHVLALLQCVASHPETRIRFLNAHIPLYLYPFLNTTSKARPVEYLRYTSLVVIAAVVKVDDPEVIGFLLQTEIIPLCLRTMEIGSEHSKTGATVIVQKILLDDNGLRYICATPERFFSVATVFAQVVQSLAEQPSATLLKHMIRCYLRLTENARACTALNTCLPPVLKDGTFNMYLQFDQMARRWLEQLLHNMNMGASSHATMGGSHATMGEGSNTMGGGPSAGGLDHLMGIGYQATMGGSHATMGEGSNTTMGGGSHANMGGGPSAGGLDHLMGIGYQ